MTLKLLMIGECASLARRPGVWRSRREEIGQGKVNPAAWDAVLVIGADAELVRRLRAVNRSAVVLALVERSSVQERLLLYSAGADECVELPCDPRELEAKVLAWRRRSGAVPPSEVVSGNLRLDLGTGRTYVDGRMVLLSTKEYQLLRYLAGRPDTVVSREELLREVWGYRSGATRTVDVHVAWLRQKLESDPRAPRHIATIRGKGYVFQVNPPRDCKEDFTETAATPRNNGAAAELERDRRF